MIYRVLLLALLVCLILWIGLELFGLKFGFILIFVYTILGIFWIGSPRTRFDDWLFGKQKQ